MRYFRPSLVLTLLAALSSGALAQDLNAVLARIDKAAPGFRGFSADVLKIKHTPVMPEDDKQVGKTLVRRAKGKDLQMRVDIDPPDQQQIVLDGPKLEIYYPKSNTIQPYMLGKARSMADQVLILGWGSTSSELLSAYNITYGGEETVAGQKTSRLVLIPKDKDLVAHVPKFEIWISEEPATSGISVQMKVYEKGGDYSLATYTNVKPRSVSESDVKLTAPKNAQRLKTIK
jgi:outer membrane lipoprotein-sorting protein